jgi:hypothetical protein
MTAPHIINPAGLLNQALGDASPDLMRHLLSTVINSLLSAEADAVCGAEYGAVSPSGSTPATATGTASWTRAPALLTWPSRNCGPGRISRSGCWNGVNGPRPRS